MWARRRRDVKVPLSQLLLPTESETLSLNSVSVLSMAKRRSLMIQHPGFTARITSITFDTPWKQPTKPPLGCFFFLGPDCEASRRRHLSRKPKLRPGEANGSKIAGEFGYEASESFSGPRYFRAAALRAIGKWSAARWRLRARWWGASRFRPSRRTSSQQWSAACDCRWASCSYFAALGWRARATRRRGLSGNSAAAICLALPPDWSRREPARSEFQCGSCMAKALDLAAGI